jgi:hypothetical protein
VSSWLDWKCYGELRYVTPPRTTTKPSRLQQRWFRNGTDSIGAICTTEYEWRDVPLVVLEN